MFSIRLNRTLPQLLRKNPPAEGKDGKAAARPPSAPVSFRRESKSPFRRPHGILYESNTTRSWEDGAVADFAIAAHLVPAGATSPQRAEGADFNATLLDVLAKFPHESPFRGDEMEEDFAKKYWKRFSHGERSNAEKPAAYYGKFMGVIDALSSGAQPHLHRLRCTQALALLWDLMMGAANAKETPLRDAYRALLASLFPEMDSSRENSAAEAPSKPSIMERIGEVKALSEDIRLTPMFQKNFGIAALDIRFAEEIIGFFTEKKLITEEKAEAGEGPISEGELTLSPEDLNTLSRALNAYFSELQRKRKTGLGPNGPMGVPAGENFWRRESQNSLEIFGENFSASFRSR
jgi:hypothetical protein